MSSKKLSLNKETIRQLGSEETVQVGGASAHPSVTPVQKIMGPTYHVAYTCVPTDGM